MASSSSSGRVPVSVQLGGFVRRHLIAMVLVGVAAVALGVPASQANIGDPVVAGRTTYAGGRTQVVAGSGDGLDASTSEPNALFAGLSGYNAGSGVGVEGASASGYGVEGLSQSSAAGVFGYNSGRGNGVEGLAGGKGIAVLADDADGAGVALRTTGRLQFLNRSGIATVASGHRSARVPVPGVTARSMVVATVQQTGGFAVQAAVPAAGSVTVYLNKVASGSTTVKVAYLVLD